MLLSSVIFTVIAAVIPLLEAIPGGFIAADDGGLNFVVAIYDQEKYICGGTIISTNFIVTAAHCFKRGREVTGIKIICKTVDLNDIKEENIRNVEEIIIHPRYSMLSRDFDIALVKSEYPNVRKLGLATYYDVYYDEYTTAVGWGLQMEPNDVPPVRLTYNILKVWQRESCNSLHIWGPDAYYLFKPLVSERMLCADVPDVGPGTCESDDGSPILTNGPEILGILSWRYDCQTPGKPSVYTSIPLMKPWILKVMTNYSMNKK
ncbi:trypsin-2-like [Lucilia sericata]|uniref:trypsin-2-like n=1 Tax=Lucilia sericata TaxID=13632 RepID=UPI0018A7FCA9|nr:trypsin-2-like [Lucilia sericata]